MKNLIYFIIIYFGLAFTFFAMTACHAERPRSKQVFWDPEKDTVWRELL